ncbi:MAG: HprK-related kinase A, partial [Burkholderiales bacterium]
RRFFRPQSVLRVDGVQPFEPFPRDHGFPLLEWGINWTLAHRANSYLLLHSGALERDGTALLLPALPGSGKSTLTAALANRGYRLLSDEFGAVHLDDGRITPVLKPVALKNESIDIIKAFEPSAIMGPSFPKTRKGTVAHMAPNDLSIERRQERASPGLIVFPQFRKDANLSLEPMERGSAFAKLAVNCFNYEVLGPAGFMALDRLIRSCECYRLTYATLDDAVSTIDHIYSRRAGNSAVQ